MNSDEKFTIWLSIEVKTSGGIGAAAAAGENIRSQATNHGIVTGAKIQQIVRVDE